MKLCSECFRGENREPAVVKVSHPNPDNPNLRVVKLVCDDHLAMLGDDYGDELKIVALLKGA